MKLNKKHIIAIYIAVVISIAGAVVYFAKASLRSTPEQRQHLPKLLADTEKIVISEHPEIGGKTLAVIENESEISSFIKAIELKRVSYPCACLGYIDIRFISEAGMTNTLNYKAKTFIKFENSWNIQGVPSKEFDELMAGYCLE